MHSAVESALLEKATWHAGDSTEQPPSANLLAHRQRIRASLTVVQSA
jgi:hypothetical protein